MTDTVVPLFPPSPSPSPSPPRGPLPDWRVVGLLRELLADAEAGRIRTCAVATLCAVPGDTALRTVLQWVDTPDLAMALSGAAAKMARDLAEE